MYPPVDEALGQVDIFVRALDQADLWSDVPPQRHLVTKSGTLGQTDLWSDVPPIEASSD